MASTGPEKEPGKNLIVASCHQELKEMEQPMRTGEEDCPLEGGEGHRPAGNNRGGQAPHWPWPPMGRTQ